MDNDTTPNTSIFTIETSSDTMSLEIESNDITEASTYMLKVSVHYTNYENASTFANFNVEIIDNCSNSATTIKSNTVIPPQSYIIGSAQIILTFDAFTPTPSYCPLVYDCEQLSTPKPSSGFNGLI